MRNKPIWPVHVDELDIAGLFYDIGERRAGTLQARRVERILVLLSRLGDDRTSKAEALRATAEMQSALSEYRWAYVVSPSTEGHGAVLLPARTEEVTPPGASEWEYGAIRFLMELTRYPGAISRLRRCEYAGCNSWFFDETKGGGQKFCTKGLCRQNHYYSDPEHQKKHRAAVRKYDNAERERNRIAEERVKKGKNAARKSTP